MNSSNIFFSFLSQISVNGLSVIDTTILKSSYIPIDLSVTNQDLNSFDVSSSKSWKKYISNYLKKYNKQVAFGGYLEKRSIYNRSAYFSSQSEETQRNIHLGLDLWCNVNTSVLAAFDGVIHSFKNNTNFGDYGPTIILKHNIKNVEFYTLYGHLSLESIKDLKAGTTVKQGQTIAYLGDATVNGDYAPHLHFQLIKDLQGNFWRLSRCF